MAGVVSRRGRFCRIGLATVCRQSERQEEEKVRRKSERAQE